MLAWEDIRFCEGNTMMKRMKTGRRGQEEIVGFVLVVVIVAIIFLVFLGIAVRQQSPVTQRDSGDVSQFLRSAMEFTSSCAVASKAAYLSLGELVRECNSGSTCQSGKTACQVLNQTMGAAIEANWKIGPDRPIKGYSFNVTYVVESRVRGVISFSKGTCKTERIGAEESSPAYLGSSLRSSLEMCY